MLEIDLSLTNSFWFLVEMTSLETKHFFFLDLRIKG
jgi:hypothetical protein